MKILIVLSALLLTVVPAYSQGNNCNYKKIMFPNGALKEEGCLRKGEKEGVWKRYGEEGHLLQVTTYKNGLKNGPDTVLFKNRKLRSVYQWKNDTPVDTSKEFNEEGDLVKVEFWVADKSGIGSNTTYRKVYDKHAKPDGTVERIDGKDYLWMKNEKHELHYEQKPATANAEKSNENRVCVLVDQMPVFAEGKTEMRDFISKNLKYPQKSFEQKVEGKVYANFVIEKDGTVSTINIWKELDEYCNEEVTRLIKKMPKWTPAQKDGQNVRYRFELPINFTLPK